MTRRHYDRPDARSDREGRQPGQAAGIRVPVERDLRRVPVHLRLRPARGAPQAQRDGRLVAGDGPGARRHRWSRRGRPDGAQGVGGERPPGHLHRPPGRLPQLQGAVAGRPDRRRLPQVRLPRPHRGPSLQPDVQDPRRAGGERGLRRLPPPGDGAGHLRQLRQRAPDQPQEAALRHRPAGQVVPQRDHARQLHLPHARVRADGDGVLRPARPGAEVVRVLVRGAFALVHRPGHPRRVAPAAPPRPRGAVPLLPRHRRRRVRSTRGDGASWRASPTAATTTSPSTPSSPASGWSTSTRRRASATSPT